MSAHWVSKENQEAQGVGDALEGKDLGPRRHNLEIRAFFFFFGLPKAYGGFQARSQIRAITAGLRHSHRHMGSERHLRPTPQLTATPDP